MQLVDETKVREIINSGIMELIRDKNTMVDFVSVLADQLLYGHLLGVAKVSVQLGMSYGFSEKKLRDLAKAGLMHDVGKLFIDRDILYRPCRLTDEEFAIVKRHPTLGYDHMKGKVKDKMMLDAIKKHHEKLGGGGYPEGTKKESFIVELITVADIYSALTEARVYKRAMPVQKALEILKSERGLNQSIVERLEELTYDDVTDILRARIFAKMYRQKYHIQDAA